MEFKSCLLVHFLQLKSSMSHLKVLYATRSVVVLSRLTLVVVQVERDQRLPGKRTVIALPALKSAKNLTSITLSRPSVILESVNTAAARAA